MNEELQPVPQSEPVAINAKETVNVAETNEAGGALEASAEPAGSFEPAESAPVPNPPAETTTPPKLSMQERREKAVTDALRTAIRDLFQHHYSANEEKLEPLDFQFRLHMEPKNKWALAFDPPLATQVLRQLEDQEADFGAFVEGRVFCFNHESATCECSAPPSPISVFDKYDSKGQPQWCDFAQKLLDAKHEDVHLLFGKKPAVLNLLQFGKELKEGQLSSFGKASKTYAVLGQVAVGYFVLPKNMGDPNAKERSFAITFQLVETRGRGGKFDLRLNTIVHSGLVPSPVELFAGDWQPGLRRARLQTMEQLAQIQGMAAHAREDKDPKRFQQHMAKIGGVLRRFSRSLSRGDRQRKRRTKHAEVRRREHSRPTDKAYEDAHNVGVEHLFFEERNDAYVAYHPHGRAHVFGKDGKHVTSFSIKPDALEKRLRSKRWKRVGEEGLAAFRAGLDAADGDGEAS